MMPASGALGRGRQDQESCRAMRSAVEFGATGTVHEGAGVFFAGAPGSRRQGLDRAG